jgi:hypothetical protein
MDMFTLIRHKIWVLSQAELAAILRQAPQVEITAYPIDTCLTLAISYTAEELFTHPNTLMLNTA